MNLGYIFRTKNAKLKLTTRGPLSEEEWEAVSAALASLRPAVVSQGAQTVTRLLEGLEKPLAEQGVVEAGWASPGNTDTFQGPLDPSVMGLVLAVGDTAVVTRSHREAHVGTMHRWIKHPAMEGENYGCGHGGCTAHVTVIEAEA
ncbi:hypothetical protein SEA_MAGRITTE_130 [Microbacterium phage Magritte]|nr:hypothetical protein SEA_MAGRITTE_130 [Microbacterium phage Magritte]